MALERVGKVFAGGFGDRVLIGVIVGFLEGVTPARAYEYIRDDLKLGYWLSDSAWQKYKRMAKGANIRDITSEDIIRELGKHHLEILGVIINHPEGRSWLDKQIVELKKKLEII